MREVVDEVDADAPRESVGVGETVVVVVNDGVADDEVCAEPDGVNDAVTDNEAKG